MIPFRDSIDEWTEIDVDGLSLLDHSMMGRALVAAAAVG
jgi:hypothetical protein